MSAVPIISVANFHKAYEGVPAVEEVSFDVFSGRIIGVVGPNGAGKTTTMRSLAGIIPPTAGSLSVAGFDVESQPIPVKQRLAYVPDDPSLFPNLTVSDHLAFTAAAYKVDNADRKAAVLLKQFELDQKRDTAAKDLSRGMRQKLAICCAYLYDPVALLFDEPLTGLDPMGIRTLKRTIVERAAAGAAVLISSHLLAMVEDVCSRILMLDHGQQKFFGTVGEFRQKFGSADDDVSLEQIFFAATDQSGIRTHQEVAVSGAR